MKKTFYSILLSIFIISCNTTISVGTNSVIDFSFEISGSICSEGKVFYDFVKKETPFFDKLFGKEEVEKNPVVKENDIVIQGKTVKNRQNFFPPKKFVFDGLFNNITVTDYFWEGFCQFNNLKRDLKFQTRVGSNNDSQNSDKRYLLYKNSCTNGNLIIDEKIYNFSVKAPYKIAEFENNFNKKYYIYITRQTYYKAIYQGENAKDYRIGEGLKDLLNKKKQLFQIVDENQKVLADFSKENFTIYDTTKDEKEIKEIIAAFLTWIKLIEIY